jgi:hypothetical protein
VTRRQSNERPRLGGFDLAFSSDGRYIACTEDLLDVNGVSFNRVPSVNVPAVGGTTVTGLSSGVAAVTGFVIPQGQS